MRDAFTFPESSDHDIGIHAQIGRALAIAVRFEENVRSLHGLGVAREASRAPFASDAEWKRALVKRLSELRKQSLRALTKDATKGYAPLMEIPVKGPLERAVDARNEVAHDVASGVREGRYSSDEMCRDLAGRLGELARRIAEGDRLVAFFVLAATGEPLPTAATFNQHPDRAAEWVLSGT